MKKYTKLKMGTRIIHSGHETWPENGALSVPIFQASTYAQHSVDSFGRYDYSRSGNPTREALEETIAMLEGGSRGFAFASGMAAISSALLLFSAGDHLVATEDIYGGSYRVLTGLFPRLGIETTFVDATDLQAIKQAIRGNTRGLFLETPSNPLLKITDLTAAAKIAKSHGIITLVDNTFMTPYFQRPLELGCDIVIHSATKFLNGHSDVLAGLVVIEDKTLAERMKFIHNGFGAVLGPQDSWLVLRGLKTLKVRMEETQRSAMLLAEWLTKQETVREVYYPGLPGHAGGDIHARQSSGAGSVVSFRLASKALARKLLEGSRLAAFAVSLGGVESILSYPAKMSHAAMTSQERDARGITDALVRLSAGLEDPEDLIADLDRLLNEPQAS